jgi:ATP-dependent HslUV protease ATP-binding subunit HslU
MNMTPKEIVSYLDDFIIGQKDAKKAIAIALRNRYRRLALDPEIGAEIMPKNILMIGPTGVGKTEIARRMAKMMNLPFVKVEATKYTEVGFVGRDVESMIRDLVIDAYKIVKEEHSERNTSKIEDHVNEQITSKLLPPLPSESPEEKQEAYKTSYSKMLEKVKNGTVDHLSINIETSNKTNVEFAGASDNMPPEFSKIQESLTKVFSNMGNDKIKKEVTVKEAKEILKIDAKEQLLDLEQVRQEALERAENGGIIFIDEMDKVCTSSSSARQDNPGKDGVQRDLLPIVEGSTVSTKHGVISTEHILFIAAGAFHVAKPSDLIAELQGRFPLRVELSSLSEENLYEILTQTKNSLLRQYKALLSVEEIELKFDDDAIKAMASLANKANESTEDIGARRLHTVIENVLEEISFEAEEHKGETITITKELVQEKLSEAVEDEDFTRYIL